MVFLYSLFGPFLLWPVEYFLPYPYIIEELFKCAVIWFGGKNVKTYLYAGFAFAFSETVLYSININAFGRVSLIFVRLLVLGILHTTTFLIILEILPCLGNCILRISLACSNLINIPFKGYSFAVI